MGVVIALLLLLGAGGYAVAEISNSQAQVAQAQAQIETARAAQDAAQAAQIAARGQATVGLGLVLALILIIVALAAVIGLIAYAWLRRQFQPRRWAPGPNAHYARELQPPPAPRMNPLDGMIQLEILRTLQSGRQQQPASLPDDVDADQGAPWW